MANPDLVKYVQTARSHGMTDDAVRTNLISAGWAADDIAEALSPNSPDVPMPPKPHPGMWVTFQYLLLFITLYISSISLGGLLYYLADKAIPDATSSMYDYVGNYLLQGYLAALIVAFPIFAILFIVLRRQLLAHPIIKGIRARQFLFYATMVVTFLIVISYVISIVYGLLSGDLTARTIAHFVITLLIAGPIFLYLLKEVRSDRVIS